MDPQVSNVASSVVSVIRQKRACLVKESFAEYPSLDILFPGPFVCPKENQDVVIIAQQHKSESKKRKFAKAILTERTH